MPTMVSAPDHAGPAAAAPVSPSPPPTSRLRAASTLAFVLAAVVSNTLHEGAHAVAGLAQGLTPTLTPFSVDYTPEGSAHEQVVATAAGPLFSLVLGLVLMRVARSWGHGTARLFWMWLPAVSVMNFAGYLFIAPFAQVGDTGQVLGRLGAPGWLFVLSSVLGALLQLGLARHFAVQVKRYARDLEAERSLAFQPWLLGTLAVLVMGVVQTQLLGAPADVAAVVIAYTLAVGVFAPMQFIFSRRVSAVPEELALGRLTRPTVLTVAVAAALVVLAAVGGVRLG